MLFDKNKINEFMMIIRRVFYFTGSFGLLFLCGCDRVIQWGSSRFMQAKTHRDYQNIVKDYIKTVHVYDIFDTVGVFDALWISNSVRIAYSEAHADMEGNSNEDLIKAFVRRQSITNDNFISFYVLSVTNVQLTAKPAPWTLSLRIDDKIYQSFEIKAVDLPVEYKLFFGDIFNNHKRAYEVKFDRKDASGKNILPDSVEKIGLHFDDGLHYVTMYWHIHPEKHKKSVVRLRESSHFLKRKNGTIKN